jgi:sugar transferase EpsL
MDTADKCTVERSSTMVSTASNMPSLAPKVRPISQNFTVMTKRLFDILASSIGLLILSPLLISAAFLIKTQMGAGIIFRQLRPGLQGKPFWIYKFRTMMETRDLAGKLLPDAQRMTKLGIFLRSTSLDEFPELFNVLRGDMSLVGPRPLLTQYLERYNSEQARRHEVRPGTTGWAQINGRNAITWEEKFKLDVWYVDNRSFGLDLNIILKTVAKVIKREGINEVGQATMGEFMGNAGHNNKAAK